MSLKLLKILIIVIVLFPQQKASIENCDMNFEA